MPRWTYTIPPDLRARLASAMSSRNAGPMKVWAEVVDWMNAAGVERPDELSQDSPVEGDAQRDQ